MPWKSSRWNGSSWSSVLAALFLGLGEDHRLDDRAALFGEEHMLGAAEADAFRAELDGEGGVFGRVGVGADAQALGLVGPAEQGAELAGHFGVHDFDGAVDDFADGAVERDRVAFLDGAAIDA